MKIDNSTLTGSNWSTLHRYSTSISIGSVYGTGAEDLANFFVDGTLLYIYVTSAQLTEEVISDINNYTIPLDSENAVYQFSFFSKYPTEMSVSTEDTVFTIAGTPTNFRKVTIGAVYDSLSDVYAVEDAERWTNITLSDGTLYEPVKSDVLYYVNTDSPYYFIDTEDTTVINDTNSVLLYRELKYLMTEQTYFPTSALLRFVATLNYEKSGLLWSKIEKGVSYSSSLVDDANLYSLGGDKYAIYIPSALYGDNDDTIITGQIVLTSGSRRNITAVKHNPFLYIVVITLGGLYSDTVLKKDQIVFPTKGTAYPLMKSLNSFSMGSTAINITIKAPINAESDVISFYLDSTSDAPYLLINNNKFTISELLPKRRYVDIDNAKYSYISMLATIRKKLVLPISSFGQYENLLITSVAIFKDPTFPTEIVPIYQNSLWSIDEWYSGNIYEKYNVPMSIPYFDADLPKFGVNAKYLVELLQTLLGMTDLVPIGQTLSSLNNVYITYDVKNDMYDYDKYLTTAPFLSLLATNSTNLFFYLESISIKDLYNNYLYKNVNHLYYTVGTEAEFSGLLFLSPSLPAGIKAVYLCYADPYYHTNLKMVRGTSVDINDSSVYVSVNGGDFSIGGVSNVMGWKHSGVSTDGDKSLILENNENPISLYSTTYRGVTVICIGDSSYTTELMNSALNNINVAANLIVFTNSNDTYEYGLHLGYCQKTFIPSHTSVKIKDAFSNIPILKLYNKLLAAYGLGENGYIRDTLMFPLLSLINNRLSIDYDLLSLTYKDNNADDMNRKKGVWMDSSSKGYSYANGGYLTSFYVDKSYGVVSTTEYFNITRLSYSVSNSATPLSFSVEKGESSNVLGKGVLGGYYPLTAVINPLLNDVYSMVALDFGESYGEGVLKGTYGGSEINYLINVPNLILVPIIYNAQLGKYKWNSPYVSDRALSSSLIVPIALESLENRYIGEVKVYSSSFNPNNLYIKINNITYTVLSYSGYNPQLENSLVTLKIRRHNGN